jgi:hypothetical protein
MTIAIRLVEASTQLRHMARYYTDDANDIHLLTHGAIIWILQRPRCYDALISSADLAAALCASARSLSESDELIGAPPKPVSWRLPATSHAP